MVRVAFAVLTVLVVSTPSFAQERDAKRPILLIPLYAANVALHGADVHSTLRALRQGHNEGNPLFRDGATGKMIGAKIAASATTIVISEKLWKRHRVLAVGTM